MSTGANCKFYQEDDGQWYYVLQRWPYGASDDYDKYGPFQNFREARGHLRGHHANPGGYSICPNSKVTCKHPSAFRVKDTHGDGEECEFCARSVRTTKKRAKKCRKK